MQEEDIHELIKECDIDGDGHISVKEFGRVMKGKKLNSDHQNENLSKTVKFEGNQTAKSPLAKKFGRSATPSGGKLKALLGGSPSP